MAIFAVAGDWPTTDCRSCKFVNTEAASSSILKRTCSVRWDGWDGSIERESFVYYSFELCDMHDMLDSVVSSVLPYAKACVNPTDILV